MELLEIVFIMAILLLVFGPKKLPELARQLGEAFYEFRKASSSIVKAVESPPIAKNKTGVNSVIKDIAERLEVNTEGKDIKQITEQIMRKIEGRNVER